jgi:hypothetical protein
MIGGLLAGVFEPRYPPRRYIGKHRRTAAPILEILRITRIA